MRLLALVRYLVADVARGQRFLPPVLLLLAVLAMLYAGDAGEAPQSYIGSSALLYPVSVWLAVVVAGTEDPVRHAVTTTAAGWARTRVGVALAALVWACGAAVVGTLAPVLTQPRPYPPLVVLTGLAANLVCAVAGVGVGLLCARPVLVRAGWTAVAALALTVAAYPLGVTPPVGAVLGALGGRVELGPALGWSAVIASGLVVAATLAAWVIGSRRG
ncbi:hypothetical protein KCV87_09330 [Actinosynnema pretiosum subsp. pretiosum]|uniref:Integral membrane protein n=1 Tax=Actinosynnema pretiosum subsp. pretiosum TaxID=103721 RepID=A0AA45LAD7_9PSEU|nr:putative integral membrane protein [Actinosynnema pretiosum subsp. pretiosum]QUF06231.1 hypothetical protein KCV87_09330 [Actinosynnema pretiosum subsp. pretiosum]